MRTVGTVGLIGEECIIHNLSICFTLMLVVFTPLLYLLVPPLLRAVVSATPVEFLEYVKKIKKIII